MDICQSLLKQLKRQMISSSNKMLSEDSFMKDKNREYYLKISNAKQHKTIGKEEFVNSLDYRLNGSAYDFKQEVLLDTSNEAEKKLAEACFDFYNCGSGSKFKWYHNEKHNSWYPPEIASIKSSSMLCFNALSWVNSQTPIELDGVVYTKILFDVKLPILNTPKRLPASMDAVLISKDGETVLFIDSKFTETFGSKYSYPKAGSKKKYFLRSSYKDLEKYYDFDIGEKWKMFYKKYILPTGSSILPVEGTNFDVKRAISNCLAIDNFMRIGILDDETEKVFTKYEIDNDKIIKFRFMNLQYEPDKNKYLKLDECYESAKECGLEFGKAIKLDIFDDLDFEYSFTSYNELLKKMPDGEKKEKFLLKYLIETLKE